MKKNCIVLIVLIVPFALSAQIRRSLDWHKDWHVGTIGGINYLTTEIKKDFSRTAMDMNPKLDGGFSFYINKRFTDNIEAGIEFDKNFFYAEKTFPNKINWLIYDTRFNNSTSHFVAAPIYAKTNTSTWYLNLIYNFLNFNKKNKTPLNFNMYLKTGIGFSSLGVELGYRDPANYEKSYLPNPLYEKGQGIHSLKDAYLTFHLGTGINYYLSPRVSVNGEFMLMFVNVDYLDGVRNYDATKLPDGTTAINPSGVFTAITQLRVGVSYHFNWYKRQIYDGIWGKTYEEFSNKFYRKKVKSENPPAKVNDDSTLKKTIEERIPRKAADKNAQSNDIEQDIRKEIQVKSPDGA